MGIINTPHNACTDHSPGGSLQMAIAHKAAEAGFSTEAKIYTQGRPDYPGEIQKWFRDALNIRPGSTVIDLGARTEKLTRLMDSMDVDVIAVEPVAAMRVRFWPIPASRFRVSVADWL
ncbi:hypothetical protein [Pseudomonas sp. F01002]|uniref:hypothetical protein n=1 Tax=Pseudomonas sp. F01002 TaxID=2555724 RepID=UPI00106C5C9B|nr:hypothetical protein [Pseudomonas sp. F01002]TFB37831.1 hypothetical protein E3W21_19230 [Pseudomonas sp. F01002]